VCGRFFVSAFLIIKSV